MEQQFAPSHAPATSAPESTKEAHPKQVALAMDRLDHAACLIADIRLGADRLLDALFVAGQPHKLSKPLHLIVKEDSSMRQYLEDLRSVGKQLEESGVLNESLRSRSNSWGLHMPLVCPDGAVVEYDSESQLAGHDVATAVDRTRLALKAFKDQKRRFFPHMDQGSINKSSKLKTQCRTEHLSSSHILLSLENEVKNVKTSTYQRLDWLKRATSLPSSTKETSEEPSKERNHHSPNKLRQGSLDDIADDKIAVIELLVPSVFRVVISLHSAGSVHPDAVSFFSPDEGGSYVHARGFSVFHVFRHITEHAATALQYFIGTNTETTLQSLLHWICGYETLFTNACSKCGRLLSMDKQSALFLPPVRRPYRNFAVTKNPSNAKSCSKKEAYHIDCFPEGA